VHPPPAVIDQELQAASAPVVTTALFKAAILLQILANPVVSPRAPADPGDITVVMVSQGTQKRHGQSPKGYTRIISRPIISLSLWSLLLFSSTAHGITYNCVNKTYPTSSCCTGEITLDPTMTSIANNAFSGCSGLTGSLIIPSSVTTIGDYAFNGCSGLTGSLILPSSVTTIRQYAFNGCSGFKGSLTISSVISFGKRAFSGCSGFTGSLTLPSSDDGSRISLMMAPVMRILR
jgi:hypothetical protein